MTGAGGFEGEVSSGWWVGAPGSDWELESKLRECEREITGKVLCGLGSRTGGGMGAWD